MIAVAYSKRVSNLVVKEIVPLKEQNNRIRDFAKMKGFRISRFYEDKSNNPESDTGFQQMRIDGMNRRFDLVILDSIYRCGRSFSYAKNLLYMTFYKMGIHFVILEDQINTMEMSDDEVERYFRNLWGEHAELYELSVRQEKYKKGKQLSDHWERYGYLLNEDRTQIVIDEEAADIVRLIFEMASEGKKKCEIIKFLNENQIETPSLHINRVAVRIRGANHEKWSCVSLSRILEAKVYMGDDSAGLTEGAVYPQIIKPELFKKANDNFYHLGTKRYTKVYLFAKIIFDGKTGKVLSYREKETDGKIMEYYHLPDDDIPVIELNEVYKKVQVALEKEKEKAMAVLEIDDEKRIKRMDEIDDSYHEKAKDLFRKSLEAQEGNVGLYMLYENGELSKGDYERRHDLIMKKQEEINSVFHELMEENKRRKIYLGKDNPWIRRFLKYDPKKKLNRKTINELVKRIEVYSKTDVTVILNTDGFEYLPKDYLKEAGFDG